MCPFCDDPNCIDERLCTCYYPCASNFLCPARPRLDEDEETDERLRFLDEVEHCDDDYYPDLEDEFVV